MLIRFEKVANHDTMKHILDLKALRGTSSSNKKPCSAIQWERSNVTNEDPIKV